MDWSALNSAVVIAALTGISFLAYQHPRAFKLLAPALGLLITIASVGIVVFDSGLAEGARLVADKLAVEERAMAVLPVSAAYRASGPYLVAGMLLTVYLLLLTFLPALLKYDRHNGAAGSHK